MLVGPYCALAQQGSPKYRNLWFRYISWGSYYSLLSWLDTNYMDMSNNVERIRGIMKRKSLEILSELGDHFGGHKYYVTDFDNNDIEESAIE